MKEGKGGDKRRKTECENKNRKRVKMKGKGNKQVGIAQNNG